MTLVFALLTFWGCSQKPVAVPLESLAELAPVLPAPEADLYTRGVGLISDPAVVSVADSVALDEGLSGAAGALALVLAQGGSASPNFARWAAYRAGYPHTLVDFAVYSVPVGSVPPVLGETLRAFDSALDVGLARARGGSLDFWVVLTARQDVEISAFPRVVAVGETIALTVSVPGDLEVIWVSPVGDQARFALADQGSFTLEEDGEWWLELLRQGATVLAVPITVGIDPPDLPPLYGLPPQATAEEALVALRAEFDTAAPLEDPILAAEARARLRQSIDSSAPTGTGWSAPPRECRGVLTCNYRVEEGIGDCFGKWLIDASTRAPLLDPGCDLFGTAQLEMTEGHRAVVVLGASGG